MQELEKRVLHSKAPAVALKEAIDKVASSEIKAERSQKHFESAKAAKKIAMEELFDARTTLDIAKRNMCVPQKPPSEQQFRSTLADQMSISAATITALEEELATLPKPNSTSVPAPPATKYF